MSFALTTALDTATLPPDAIEVGRIGEAWGIKGWFRVVPYSGEPEALFSSKRWYLLPAARGARQFEGVLLLLVTQCKPHADGVVAHSLAIPDRNAAELLKGARILVPRTSFPSLEEGEFYWVDLIGCSVSNREGIALGTVHDLLPTGPQTVLVLHQQQGDQTVERLIPFVDAFVDTVDIAGKQLVVDWQPDY